MNAKEKKLLNEAAKQDRFHRERAKLRRGGAICPDPRRADWEDLFKAVIDGPLSVECTGCNAILIGDDMAVPIICWACFEKQNPLNEEDNAD